MLSRVVLRVPAPAFVPSLLLHSRHDVSGRIFTIPPLRTYATRGRPPKTVVGEPSEPVKRAVKEAAAAPLDGTSAAEEEVTAKQLSTDEPKKRRLTLKQKQALAAKRKRQVIAERSRRTKEKAAKKLSASKEAFAELKKTALSPPALGLGIRAWACFIKDRFAEIKSGEGEARGVRIGSEAKKLSPEWKRLDPAALEHYNHIARVRRETTRAEYRKWVESHTPDQIRRANIARKQLRVKEPKKKHQWAAILDERAPKRPTSAFALFSTDRNATGDYVNISISNRSKLLAQEWKGMDGSEKERYEKLASQDRERYAKEYLDLYGFPHNPPYIPTKKRAPAAAAA